MRFGVVEGWPGGPGFCLGPRAAHSVDIFEEGTWRERFFRNNIVCLRSLACLFERCHKWWCCCADYQVNAFRVPHTAIAYVSASSLSEEFGKSYTTLLRDNQW